MANGFGSLYVGASALRSEQNALNVVANNLSNVNTKGYVRQQVIFADVDYTPFATAAVSTQQLGLGVSIGDVVHARDIFLDKAYRSESGRQAFYAASYDAVSEVETYLQESDGVAFKTALNDLYEAFAEFSKDPADAVNQNLVMQKASLFITRTRDLDNGLREYQQTINKKISDDVVRINELGKKISELNLNIQRVESAGIETAMDLRDMRDLYLDELSSLAKISTTETNEGVVKVQLEGVEFVTETGYMTMAVHRDARTGFETPYWPQLSDLERDEIYEVFNMDNIDATKNTDSGEVKALLMARGDHWATYLDMDGLSQYDYERGLANSVMMNAEAEIDKLCHSIVTAINNVLCPNKAYGGADVTATDAHGNEITITKDTLILDTDNCFLGSDDRIPPHELFVRNGCERYTEATLPDGTTVYIYNEEDPSDTAKCYTVHSTNVNPDLVEEESLLPHKAQNDNVGYDLGAELEKVWDDNSYKLNPSDETPCTFSEFYTKMVGELGTVGSIYNTTAQSLKDTTDSIDFNRQSVIGVSSDEELTNMIKFQAAYNAASRYISVVSSMIEHLLTSLY